MSVASFFSNHFHAYVFVRGSTFSFVSQANLEDPLYQEKLVDSWEQDKAVVKHHYSTL